MDQREFLKIQIDALQHEIDEVDRSGLPLLERVNRILPLIDEIIEHRAALNELKRDELTRDLLGILAEGLRNAKRLDK